MRRRDPAWLDAVVAVVQALNLAMGGMIVIALCLYAILSAP